MKYLEYVDPALVEEVLKHLKNVNNSRYSCPPEYNEYVSKVDFSTMSLPTSEGDTTVYLTQLKEKKLQNAVALVNIHGGGFMRPHGTRDDMFCAAVVAQTGAVCFDVDYKLSPEYVFPSGFNQIYEICEWIYNHAEEYGCDKNKIVIAGGSAGGNLAGAVSLRSNVEKKFPVRLQIMFYPVTDTITYSDEKRRVEGARPLTGSAALVPILYTGNDADKMKSPYCNIIGAPDEYFVGIADAVMITAFYDELRYEGEAYAVRLVEGGAKVISKRCMNSKHGFLVDCKEEYKEAMQLIVDAINDII